MGDVVIQSSRRLLLLMAAAGAAAAVVGSAIGVVLISGHGYARGVGGAFAVALGGVVSLSYAVAGLLRPYRLTLTQEALVVEQPFNDTRRIRWSDVESFYVVSRDRAAQQGPALPLTQPAADVICYKLAKSSGLDSLAMGSGAGFGRAEALPAVAFELSAYAVAQRLNEFRAAALASA